MSNEYSMQAHLMSRNEELKNQSFINQSLVLQRNSESSSQIHPSASDKPNNEVAQVNQVANNNSVEQSESLKLDANQAIANNKMVEYKLYTVQEERKESDKNFQSQSSQNSQSEGVAADQVRQNQLQMPREFKNEPGNNMVNMN